MGLGCAQSSPRKKRSQTQDRTRQNDDKKKQDKTRRDKTRRDKTRRDRLDKAKTRTGTKIRTSIKDKDRHIFGRLSNDE